MLTLTIPPTQVIIAQAENHLSIRDAEGWTPRSFRDALHLFMDLVRLFRHIIVLLLRNNRQQGRDDRRKKRRD